MKCPTIELLERRRLLSDTFAAHINFQPATATVPTGYVADSGAVFGDRGNGLSYGWNAPKPAQVLARKVHKQPSGTDAPRFDTFAVMHAKGRGSLWEISVPNGIYQVGITAGDPNASGRQRINVNGALVVDGRASRTNRWVSDSAQITVTDGFLKLTAPKNVTSKIDFIDITQTLGAGPPPPPGALVIPQADRQVLTLGKNAAGGVEVTLNGIVTDYAPGQWTAVSYTGNANIDSVLIQATVVPTTIVVNSVTNVFVGNVAGSANGTQQITSPLEIDLPNGGQATFDDRGDTVGRTVSLTQSATAGKFSLTGLTPAAITFAAPNAAIDTGSGADAVSVLTTPSATLNILNSGGTDAMKFGNGSLASFQGPTMVQASAGTNNVTIDDSADAAGNTFNMQAPILPTPAGAGPMPAINFGLTFNALHQISTASEIEFQRQTTTSVTVKSDVSTTNAFTASYDPAAPGALVVNYQGGANDSATVNIDEPASTFNITSRSLFAGPLSLGVNGPVHFTGAGGSASLSVLSNQLQTLTLSNGKFSQGTGVVSYTNTPSVVLSTTNFFGAETVNLDYGSGDALPPVLQLQGAFYVLGFPSTGDPLAGHRIDLATTRRLLIAYNTGQGKQLQDLLRKYLHNAYTGSSWRLSGTDMITSSYAAGYTDNSQGIAYTDSEDGVVTGQQFNTIQLRVSEFGDTNVDNLVDSTDQADLQAHLNKPGDWNWDQGDLNYDGVVNSQDQAILDSHLT